jgi:hypothetical protein
MTMAIPNYPSHAAQHPSVLAEKLKTKLRNSRFFTISLLLHMVLITTLGSMVLFRAVAPPDDFIGSGDGGGGLVAGDTAAAPPPPPVALPPTTVSPPTPVINTPSTQLDVITTLSAAPSNFAVAVAPVAPPTMSTQTSSALPTRATGGPGSAAGLPSIMQGRAGPRRAQRAKETGQKKTSEEAVMNGLRWLKTKQNPDGTWGQKYKGAMTGLALLCFLGHGENYYSVEFGETVRKGVNALVTEGEKQGGRLAFSKTLATQTGPYEHGIATYALAEAFAITREERIPPVLTNAVKHITQGQGPDGGWMYRYDRSVPSDTSVSGWQFQALKAVHLTQLNIPGVEQALDKAVGNLERVFDPKTGHFGYRNKGDRKGSLTGVGALNMLMWKQGKGSMVRDAIKAIVDGPTVNYHEGEQDLYAWYYHTQACLLYGGASWDKWNRMFQDQIALSQNPDGSWPPSRSKEAAKHGPIQDLSLDGAIYRTALCVLMLEVYYRYLPSTQG